MPRMQVYLPEDLYAELKQRKLPASELLQEAIRAELRRQDQLAAADEFLQELIEEYGEPTPEDIAWAEDVARRIKEHQAGADPAAEHVRPKRSKAS